MRLRFHNNFTIQIVVSISMRFTSGSSTTRLKTMRISKFAAFCQSVLLKGYTIYVSTNTTEKHKLNHRNTFLSSVVGKSFKVPQDAALGRMWQRNFLHEKCHFCSAGICGAQFLSLWSVPWFFFQLCFLFLSVSLLFPKLGSCSGCSTKPNQVMPLSSHALGLGPLRYPWILPPHFIHVGGTRVLQAFMWTRPGHLRAPAGAAPLHLPIMALPSHHLSQAPQPSSFSTFLGIFSINRKQLPGGDSPFPSSREIIFWVHSIQPTITVTNRKNMATFIVLAFAKAQVKIWFSCPVCEPGHLPQFQKANDFEGYKQGQSPG